MKEPCSHLTKLQQATICSQLKYLKLIILVFLYLRKTHSHLSHK